MRLTRTAYVSLAACLLSACVPGAGEGVTQPSRITTETSTSFGAPSSSAPTPAQPRALEELDLEAELGRIAQQVTAAFGGEATIALSNAEVTLTSGDARPYVAWSTIKVPIAVAALSGDPSLSPVAEAAITISDNLAAETLWSATTPERVEAVLAQAGTPIDVNTVVTRPGFTSFGQTVFSTADQATFAAGLPCVKDAAQVLDMMSRVSADQSYGIGTLENARFKGGWGPDETEAYVVRQLGNVGGRGIALTAAPADGTYVTAQAMATQLALAAGELTNRLSPSACG